MTGAGLQVLVYSPVTLLRFILYGYQFRESPPFYPFFSYLSYLYILPIYVRFTLSRYHMHPTESKLYRYMYSLFFTYYSSFTII